MKHLLFSIAFILIFLSCQTQECVKEFDLTQFTMQGAINPEWKLLSPVDVINEAYLFPATMYVGKQNMINVLIKGTVSVETGGDNDFIGVVFGYHQPTQLAHNNTYNYFLFDWKAETESASSFAAFEGFRLSHYNGFITAEEQKKYMWGRVDDPPIRDLLDEKNGDTLGWEPLEKYQFELLYTSNRIRILIDDEIIFEREGCFDAGKFGFYCMSQELTRFENFTYEYIVDFVPIPTSVCIDETVNFYSFDLNCSAFPDFVESIHWDFGDGHTSNEINPDHIYEKDGDYQVSLVMHSTDGCIDTVIKPVTVRPSPIVDLGNDTILAACSSIKLDAGNPGSSYQWSTGAQSQIIDLTELSSDTTVWVLVDKKGCFSADSIFIEIESIQEKLYFPNAFTPDGDGKNDTFEPIGITNDVSIYHMAIFNRWGQQVFESNDPNEGWKGRYDGKTLGPAAYAYKVSYRIERSCTAAQDFSEIATVILLR